MDKLQQMSSLVAFVDLTSGQLWLYNKELENEAVLVNREFLVKQYINGNAIDLVY
jgi:hypothetical protein